MRLEADGYLSSAGAPFSLDAPGSTVASGVIDAEPDATSAGIVAVLPIASLDND